MDIFGQNYDLENCTPEERANIEEWYAHNKEVDVPVDKEDPDGQYRTEADRVRTLANSDPMDIALALESLGGNSEFKPDLKGKDEYIKLYCMVHPLGGNLSVEDAAKQCGINKVTAYRRLTRLFVLNPEVYDLHKWPTKTQLDVYRLIHPDLGGLTYHEAARALKSTYQHVVQLMCRMRKTHPSAFAFERIRRPKIVSYNPKIHDEQATEKF